MDILAKFTDEESIKRFGLTKTQLYKLRKGMMTFADIHPTLEQRMLEFYHEHGTEIAKSDPENPDYSDPGFDRYCARFREDVQKDGLTAAYNSWTRSIACACVGRSDGDPFCSCEMRWLTADRYAKQQIVPTEEGEALMASMETA